MTNRTLRAFHLKLGAAAIALTVATPAWAQTAEEDKAQAANPTDTQPTNDPGTIVVTATKRATTLQDVPFSINAQTQEDIQRANASTLEDISRNVAGLSVQNLGPGQSQVSVRGVSAGVVARDQPGVKEQVGVYLDESVISLSLFTPDLDLYDLNRIETLRGPQGTLFGSGSVGGTLRYITNQPRLDRIEGSVEANVNHLHGGSNGGHLKGAVNLPIADIAALRVVAYGQKFAGFIDAKGPAGEDNINDGERFGTRVSLLMQPSESIKVTPRFIYQRINTDGFNRQDNFNLFANQFTDPPYYPGEREQYLLLKEGFDDKLYIGDLTASYDMGPVELTSVSSYTHRDVIVSRDASALTGSISLDVGFGETAANLPSNLLDTTGLKQFTQELRIASSGNGPLQWVLGGFFSTAKRNYSQELPTPGYDVYVSAALNSQCLDPVVNSPGDCAVDAPLPADRVPFVPADLANGFGPDSPYNAGYGLDSRQKAVFGEASYDFGQFKLTAGGRLFDFKETRDFRNGGLFSPAANERDKVKSSGFSPRVIATYQPNRDLSINLQAAKGFRLGGVNDPLNTPLCDNGVPNGPDFQLFGQYQTFGDETMWNYEAGVKYGKGPISFNAAAFRSNIRDLQVTLTAGTCSSRISFNVPKAHSQGLEAEFTARPMKGLDFALSGSLVEAEFDTTVRTGDGTQIPGLKEGNRLPSVPKFQASARVGYTMRALSNADLKLDTNVQHVGSRYSQPDDQENNPRTFNHPYVINGMDGTGSTTQDLKLPAYTLVNASAGLAFDSGLDVVAYVKNIFDTNALLSFDRERGGQARYGFNVGQPREVGLTLRKSFEQYPVIPAAEPVAVAPPPPAAAPATQTCADGSVILATDSCPLPPPPPAPAPERG